MPKATLTKTVNTKIGGVVFSGTIVREQTGESSVANVSDIGAGKAGTLTTRTDNNTGIATLSVGHGIISTDVVDVYWLGGVRYDMVATVVGNAVTVDGGAGDNLPAQTTALVVCKRLQFEVSFDPTIALMLVINSDERASVRFMATAVVAKAYDNPAGESQDWDGSGANPLGADPITVVNFSNGGIVASSVSFGVVIDSVN